MSYIVLTASSITALVVSRGVLGLAVFVPLVILACEILILSIDLSRLTNVLVRLGNDNQPLLPRMVSSLGKSAMEAFEGLIYRLNWLQWQIDRAARPRKDSSLVLKTNLGNLLKASTVDKEAYEKTLDVLSDKSGADAFAIIYKSAADEIKVISRGVAGSRFDSAVKGDVSTLTDSETIKVEEVEGKLSAFGFKYCIIARFEWKNGDVAQKGMIWFGYKRYRPGECEIELARQSAAQIEAELPAVFELHQLSTKARDAESKSDAKSQFLAHMSHDIRTPLNNIRHCLLAMQEHKIGYDEALTLNAIQSCDMLTELVSTILDYSIHQAGRLKAVKASFEMRSVVKEVVEQYELQAKVKGIELKFDSLDHSLWSVHADVLQIRRVLGNLLGNAIKYTPKGGTVAVSGGVVRGEVFVNVADTGPGLNEKEQREIFEPYVRLKSDCAGIGLGLAICKILCELNGGKVAVRSKKDEGAVFSISLPEAEGVKTPSIQRRKVPLSVIKGAVLVVDDDEDCVASLAKHLRRAGLKIITATSTRDALTLLNFEKPIAAITDNGMAEGGALRLLNFIKRKRLEVPVLVVTGNESAESRCALRDAGANDIMLKPAHPAEIVRWVEERIEGASVCEFERLNETGGTSFRESGGCTNP